MHTLIKGLSLFLICAGLLACESSSQTDATTTTDSLTVMLPDSGNVGSIISPAEAVPDLLGQWQLQEMWVGNSLMSVGDVGETYLQFKANGTVVSYAPNLSPDSSSYAYAPADQRIEAPALQGTQTIKTLSESELVLTYQVDGEEVRSVYVRKGAK
jgi:hypothetical protein